MISLMRFSWCSIWAMFPRYTLRSYSASLIFFVRSFEHPQPGHSSPASVSVL